MRLPTPAHALIAFNFSADDYLRGNPKFVRAEKREGTQEKFNLQSETKYNPRKRVTERRAYHPDGKISIREQYEYTGDRLSMVRSFNEAGLEVQIIDVRMLDSATQENVVRAPDGKGLDRSITRRSPSGQVIESRSTSASGGSEIRLTARYDSQDRPVDAEVTFLVDDRVVSGIAITYEGDGSRAEIRTFPSDRTTPVASIDSGILASTSITTQLGDRARLTVEKIDATDSQRNWTKKTISERNMETGNDESVAAIYRTITYC